MIPVGSGLGRTSETNYNDAQQALLDANGDAGLAALANGDIKEANEDGERANAVLISGAVLTPLFLGGAVALIVIGVKKRNASNSQAALRPADTLTAAPSFGRNFSGVSFSGRF